jgi:aldehyde dehydrogenase (NAD+)
MTAVKRLDYTSQAILRAGKMFFQRIGEETRMTSADGNLYINGGWHAATGGAKFPVMNPANGDVFREVADGTRADAKAAIEAAQAAFPAWSGMNHAQRARILHKAGDILEARAQEIQAILVDESGSWIGKTMFETGYASGVFRAAAAAAYQVNGEILPSEHGKISLVMRVPLGVVSVISPWNFPMILSEQPGHPPVLHGQHIGAARREDVDRFMLPSVAGLVKAGHQVPQIEPSYRNSQPP